MPDTGNQETSRAASDLYVSVDKYAAVISLSTLVKYSGNYRTLLIKQLFNQEAPVTHNLFKNAFASSNCGNNRSSA